MSKILVYGFENDKLWFGKVTLWSWLMAGIKNSRLIKVKPIKGFEKYAYYKDHLFTFIGHHRFTNEWNSNCLEKTTNPLEVIAFKEYKTLEEIKRIPSIH